MTEALLLIIVVIILTAWYFGYINIEQFRACGTCDQKVDMQKNAVINPFVYPYSGNWDPDKINAQEHAARLQHRNEPDHAPETE